MTNKETLEEAFKNTYLGDKISFNSDIGKAFELGYNIAKEQDLFLHEKQKDKSVFESLRNHYENKLKIQQEQDKNKYSEEEVLNIIKARENYLNNAPKNSLYIPIKQWFNQFKKK